ncbi:hypothetical protein AAU57_09925 [Nonlabens sp. YIK11]|uniref:arsenate reductase family protein n=1 Tax=Nonlabens sp. YIK11 TaxID=1453349 RepID=UPI0006DC4633|nr:hypothetical protein [Nonlabens sp. YIK11]KQC33602.1 hypothetical protein AAU57_09925 [Nonlabens sp. YIK11]
MVSIATDEHEITLIYNSDIKNHKEIFAYAKSADDNLNAIDVTKQKLTGTFFTELADLLGIQVKDLIPTDHSAFVQKHGEHVKLDNDGAIKILQHEPDMLIYPIAVKGKKAIVAKLYGDITQFFDTDTAAVNIP